MNADEVRSEFDRERVRILCGLATKAITKARDSRSRLIDWARREWRGSGRFGHPLIKSMAIDADGEGRLFVDVTVSWGKELESSACVFEYEGERAAFARVAGLIDDVAKMAIEEIVRDSPEQRHWLASKFNSLWDAARGVPHSH